MLGFPGVSDPGGSIPGLGSSPGGGHGNPLQYSCLENPHGQRSWVGYSRGAWQVFLYCLCHTAHGILIPLLGIEPKYTALEAQSLGHWTTGEISQFLNWVVFLLLSFESSLYILDNNPFSGVSFVHLWLSPLAVHLKLPQQISCTPVQNKKLKKENLPLHKRHCQENEKISHRL